ncbi:MAG: hypothetical protein WBX25_20215 [Rhodomicrobium sp.]
MRNYSSGATERAKTQLGERPIGQINGPQPSEDDARLFLVRYLAFEDAALEHTVSLLENTYAEKLYYFGEVKTKRDVLEEHSKFVARWPIRKHLIVPDSLKITCNTNERQCVADALIDWDVTSKERNARSQGRSTWHMVLTRDQGGMTISAIDGKVLARQISKLNSEPGLCLGPLCLFDPAQSQNELSASARRALRVSSSVSEGLLNMRDGPGVRHAVSVAVPAGSSLWQVGPCIKDDDGVSRYKWCNVEWNGSTGWASASGLETLEGALEDR